MLEPCALSPVCFGNSMLGPCILSLVCLGNSILQPCILTLVCFRNRLSVHTVMRIRMKSMPEPCMLSPNLPWRWDSVP